MSTHRRKIYIFENTYQMSNALVELWVAWASEAIADHHRFTAALSGGRTPVEFYSKLSSLNQFSIWQKTFLFFADERFVSPDNPASHFKLLREYLYHSIPIPDENVFPVPTHLDSAENAALSYEGMIQGFFNLTVGQFPQFDLMILGIGQDGHTASLFPEHPALDEHRQLVVATSHIHAPHPRVSLSLPVINQSRKIVFIVSGRDKASVVRAVLDGDKKYPAALVSPTEGELYFFLDSEAAKMISIGENFRQQGDAVVIET